MSCVRCEPSGTGDGAAERLSAREHRRCGARHRHGPVTGRARDSGAGAVLGAVAACYAGPVRCDPGYAGLRTSMSSVPARAGRRFPAAFSRHRLLVARCR